jgi:hypothetical protein
VLDTAPTGHTLLLLDATGAYHRETVRAYRVEHSGRITTPLMRLGDPSYSKILLVTLAETTPVTEATELQANLRRAGIEPYAWVINSSLAAIGSSRCSINASSASYSRSRWSRRNTRSESRSSAHHGRRRRTRRGELPLRTASLRYRSYTNAA